MTYNITNNGPVDATNFYLDVSSISTPWSVNTNNCGSLDNPIILAPESSCSLSLRINSETTGSNNFDLANISSSWTDQVHPSSTSKIFSGTAYVNVYDPAGISITSAGLSSYGNISQNESFTIAATLTGGYNVPDQPLLLSVTPTESVTFNNNQCMVNSSNSQCAFSINVSAVTGSYTFVSSNTTADGVTVNPSTINFALPFSCVADGENACGCLIQNDGSESPLMWYGSSLTNDGYGYKFDQESAVLESFNSNGGHCGYTDWRIPSIIATLNSYEPFPNPQVTGDFGSLGNYAAANGFVSLTNLAAWLNSNGFNLTEDCGGLGVGCYYWSSSYVPAADPGVVWVLSWYNGSLVPTGLGTFSHILLPVRGGQ